MPATEQYQVDVFSIITLIACVLIVVFLVIAAIYFYDLMNFKPPTNGESSFLFWTSIIMAIIFFGIGIYALIRIFTHKSVIYEELQPKPKQVINNSQVPIRQQPQVINNSQVPIRQVSQIREYSDIPMSQQTNIELNQELMNLQDSYGA